MQDTEKGIKLIVRKKGAAPNAVRSAYTTTSIRPRSGARRAAGVTAKLAKRGYRPDLRAVSVPPLKNIYISSFLVLHGLMPLQVVSGHTRFASYCFWFLESHHLEPAGPPQGTTKVGCGHVVQNRVVRVETDQISLGHAPCRYRVPFDAPRGSPDSLALTFFRFTIILFRVLSDNFVTSR